MSSSHRTATVRIPPLRVDGGDQLIARSRGERQGQLVRDPEAPDIVAESPEGGAVLPLGGVADRASHASQYADR